MWPKFKIAKNKISYDFQPFEKLEEIEMKLESVNASPINNSTSTIDTPGDSPKLEQHSSSRAQSSRTILTEIAS
ncbi:unnamed protein product [Rotaria socialis]|uniref:Uncharacterized protein n=1 Tax=Rotaria socialis TaxID=392032 RepID=A0A821Z417_9BILA|nr:unnamed protein product [Rotaria socialis]